MKLVNAGPILYLLILLCIAPTACSAPTPTSDQPTQTPESQSVASPLNTSAPSTGEAQSTSINDSVFGAAIQKVKGATAYRLDMRVTGKGSFGLGSSGTPEPGATPSIPEDKEITLMSMKGEINGGSSHFSLQGLFAAFLGVDPSKPLEVVTVGDKSYIHGPVSLLGATEDKWYVLPPDQASVAKPPLTPDTLLSSFTSTGLDPSDFQKSGPESLDNHSCDVYSGDRAAVEKAFKGVGQASGSEDLSAIDTAEFKFWICDDGYLHQVRMNVTGHAQDKPDQTGSFLMEMHVSDIGTNIAIEAPQGAEPLKVPSFLGTETPTPIP